MRSRSSMSPFDDALGEGVFETRMVPTRNDQRATVSADIGEDGPLMMIISCNQFARQCLCRCRHFNLRSTSARNTSPGAPGPDSQSNVLCRGSSMGLNASPRAFQGLIACVSMFAARIGFRGRSSQSAANVADTPCSTGTLSDGTTPARNRSTRTPPGLPSPCQTGKPDSFQTQKRSLHG